MSRGATIVVEDVELPAGVWTLPGFRAWVAALPDAGPRLRPTFSPAGVFVEMSPQDYDSHEPVCAEVGEVLRSLARELDLGRFFVAPSWFTHAPARLSTEPDAFLVRWDALRSGRVRVNPRRRSELLGAPSWALEVVSRSSARKDLVHLVDGYARAGVEEYWVVDAREPDDVAFVVHTRARGGRLRPRRAGRDGWVRSPFWGRAFRFVRGVDPAGGATFRLESRR